MARPKYDFGQSPIATIPARSFWDAKFKLYKPTAAGIDGGDAIVANYTQLAASDEVRMRVFDSDNTAAKFTFDDQNNSVPNGSSLEITERGDGSTKTAEVEIKIDDNDLDLAPGDYGFIIDVKDIDDGGRYHIACRGVVRIVAGPT